ncbi:MAG: hypothetical protein JXA78_00540 [Anaerolineales bacterium]|nr:hypothetical protein [Anaerolineales bacterium]
MVSSNGLLASRATPGLDSMDSSSAPRSLSAWARASGVSPRVLTSKARHQRPANCLMAAWSKSSSVYSAQSLAPKGNSR